MSEKYTYLNIDYKNARSLEYLRFILNQTNFYELDKHKIEYPVSFNICSYEIDKFSSYMDIDKFISEIDGLNPSLLTIMNFSVLYGKRGDSKPRIFIKLYEFDPSGYYTAQDENELFLYINTPPENARLSNKKIKELKKLGYDFDLIFILQNSIIEEVKYDENNIPFSPKIRHLIGDDPYHYDPNSLDTIYI